MSAAVWYYADNGQQIGPMTEQELKSKFASGAIHGKTLVFGPGLDNWAAFDSVPGLSTASAPSSAPPPPRPQSSQSAPVHCHEIDYEIFGAEMQFVEVELDPGETVIAEAGAMMFMESGIEMETRFGDGSEPDKGFMGKLFEGAKRKMTGESLFMTWFTNKGHGKKRVAFASPFPGRIVPIDMKTLGGEFVCQKDAFLCAALGTKVDIAINRKIGTGFFGGEGFIMQRLQGDGMAFVHASGTIVERELQAGETIRLDTGCLVGYTGAVNYDIQMEKSLKSMFFGGEGMFLATLTGPGHIWLQSLPFSRLAERIYRAAPQTGGSRKGEGSLLDGLGGLGNLLDGD